MGGLAEGIHVCPYGADFGHDAAKDSFHSSEELPLSFTSKPKDITSLLMTFTVELMSAT